VSKVLVFGFAFLIWSKKGKEQSKQARTATATNDDLTLDPLSSPPLPSPRTPRSDDALFYDAPRFVTHIDDAAIASLTQFYSEVFPAPGGGGAPGSPALLDLCSSWISHYPKNYKAARVTGLGMNAEELKKNAQLTESVVQDLNKDPRLPFEVRGRRRRSVVVVDRF
jgi:hypothetical protein